MNEGKRVETVLSAGYNEGTNTRREADQMTWMTIVYKLAGYVWVPKEDRATGEMCILHISDTPHPIYPALAKLIKTLKPTHIIHTGDLVDNIKLEIFPAAMPRYQRRVAELIKLLESSGAKEVHLCLGNHDDFDTVQRLSKRCTIHAGNMSIPFDGVLFSAAHYAIDALNDKAKYCLFGHNLEVKNTKLENQYLLNGIETVNVIFPKAQRVLFLEYPMGTNDLRLVRYRIGL